MSAVASPVSAPPFAIEIANQAAQLNALSPYIRYKAGDPLKSRDRFGWINEADLAAVDAPAQQRLLRALSHEGFGGNRRAVSASILLRYGWSSGYLIGLWLTRGQVAIRPALALRFTSNTVLSEIAVKSCDGFLDETASTRAALYAALSHELIWRAEPIVEAHHAWSGFSRKALWSMVTSSWAAQFIQISELIGDPERGLTDARHVLGMDARIAAASPDLYVVEAEGKRGACQRRQLCCLWFKGPKRQFCSSCPIIADSERLTRNRACIAQRRLPNDKASA